MHWEGWSIRKEKRALIGRGRALGGVEHLEGESINLLSFILLPWFLFSSYFVHRTPACTRRTRPGSLTSWRLRTLRQIPDHWPIIVYTMYIFHIVLCVMHITLVSV